MSLKETIGRTSGTSRDAARCKHREATSAGMLRWLRYDDQQPLRFLYLIFFLTTLAELLTILPDLRLGIFLHMSVLILLLYSLLYTEDETAERLQTVLLLIPLIRVFSLALPLASWPRISWYFATSVPLFAAMMLIVRSGPNSWNRQELGLTLHRLPLQAAITVSGLLLGWMEYNILRIEPLITELSWQTFWLPALILLICTGYLEELLFRGLLQNAAISLLGRWHGLLFQAAFFAVLHIGYASLIDVLFVFAVGLAFGIFVERTDSLIGVTLAHGLTNSSMFLLWPFWLT